VLAGGQARTLPGPPPTLVLPLLARGRTLGAFALTLGPDAGGLGVDRALVEDLAGRAAIALDNARLYRDIQEADRRKDEFLAMLAHELRNPLAPVRSAVEILRRIGPEQPELQWARDMIDRQVQHIVRLVDDLLDVSRITRGVIHLRPAPVDVAGALARAVELARPLVDSRQHEVTVTLPERPLWVVADPTRLEQVLNNLLNNAAKYTPPGGRLALAARAEGDEVVFSVRDSGAGIPPDMLDRVFEPFVQVDRSLDRTQGGLGIGLTLVRRLVELQGGTVRAQSEGPGKGSEFTFRLPAAPAGPGEPRLCRERGGPASANGSGRRVLVVDDNVDGAQSLAFLLQAAGYTIAVCHDGPSAVELAGDFEPDVVLLDIGLPGLDGYEVARRLRAGPRGGEMVLVAVTGYGQEQDYQRTREAGFDHHFVKPVDPEIILTLLARGAALAR
jgi:signal transduction histidine kinase/ActR/RegA family two-component response regulator